MEGGSIKCDPAPCGEQVDSLTPRTLHLSECLLKSPSGSGCSAVPPSTCVNSDGSNNNSNNSSTSEAPSDEDEYTLQAGVAATVDVRMCASLSHLQHLPTSSCSPSSEKSRVLPDRSSVDVPPEWQGKSSVMIRNLAVYCTENYVDNMIKKAGFEGTYDYLYMPVTAAGVSKGYAFVNFFEAHTAYRFKCLCEKRQMGLAAPGATLNVRPANLQWYYNRNSTSASAANVCGANAPLSFQDSSRLKEKREEGVPGSPQKVILHGKSSSAVSLQKEQRLLQQGLSDRKSRHNTLSETVVQSATAKEGVDQAAHQRRYCHRCGVQVKDTHRFCLSCGTCLRV
eukprot:TRINITY_DN58293_c0_g1_i1.p1 TRINITY_DN58293_c0_g1~~TRINITY_DN58293_c0_g1_i1.p1  ORF type:complete len:339 (+),score=37.68 TRINITY_DN58293_c0_g1_i1:66-1082(+)